MAEALSTVKIYLEEPETLETEARVARVAPLDDARHSLVLDQTCLFAAGGGQPCDQGTARNGSGTVFAVDGVRTSPAGAVEHQGVFDGPPFSVGESVRLSVDGARRALHSAWHTAGHLVDASIESLGYAWAPGKGCHAPGASFVEYRGVLPADETTATLLARLDAAARRIIAENRTVAVRHLRMAEVGARAREWMGEAVRTQERVRMVQIDGFTPLMCGGTHVRTTGALQGFGLLKMSAKKGIVRICYTLAH
jgi:alanyl-tRNA synthetase